jgi:protein involved in polysaccharide export with SLBB domain
VALAELAATQQVSGEFMVASDGTVRFGSYGSVPVVGLTLDEAKRAIEHHLSQFLDSPEISVDVFAYNSRAYYIILQGAGLGDRVYRLPFTGNETVLDAIANINGLETISSKRIWVARPTRDSCNSQVLPVDWCAISQAGVPATNYQLMPGDRVFVEEDKMVALDTRLAKLFAPFERMMGFTLLGTETATRLSGPVLRGGGNPLSGF